jgi:hypothetical protein
MAVTWLSYADIAKALGTSPEAARQKAIRGRWRRQRGNDGRALVLVDLEAAQARTRPDDARTKRPDDARTVAALEAHIATLQADIAKADARRSWLGALGVLGAKRWRRRGRRPHQWRPPHLAGAEQAGLPEGNPKPSRPREEPVGAAAGRAQGLPQILGRFWRSPPVLRIRCGPDATVVAGLPQ